MTGTHCRSSGCGGLCLLVLLLLLLLLLTFVGVVHGRSRDPIAVEVETTCRAVEVVRMLLLVVLLLVHVVVVHLTCGHVAQAVHASSALAALHGILGQLVHQLVIGMAIIACSAAVRGIVGAVLDIPLVVAISVSLALRCCLCCCLLGKVFPGSLAALLALADVFAAKSEFCSLVGGT